MGIILAIIQSDLILSV